MVYSNTSVGGRLDGLHPWVSRGLWFVVEWLPLALLAALWELVSGGVVPVSILPPPSAVGSIAVEMVLSGEILADVAVSLYRVSWGLGLSIAVGVSVGVGMARWSQVEDFFDVLLSLLYPIPKAALVPLAILWLSSDTQIAVLIVFLACLLPIVLNAYNAADGVDQNLIRSARMMGTSDRMIVWKVIVPDTVPEILTGIRQAIPFAFIALVSAEFIAGDSGLGFEILRHGQIGNYPSMFAVVVLVSGLAYVLVRSFELARAYTVAWT